MPKNKNKVFVRSEHEEQVKLFEWAKRMGPQIPELGLLFAIPNGGHRLKMVAKKLKAEGVKPGVPDTCLPVARGGFHGLFIEMKRKNGRTPAEGSNQDWWLRNLAGQGYCCLVCRGAKAAIKSIEKYIMNP